MAASNPALAQSDFSPKSFDYQQVPLDAEVDLEKLTQACEQAKSASSLEHSFEMQSVISCINCLDLTSLNQHDSESSINSFANKAYRLLSSHSELGVAAICTYPQFAAVVDAVVGINVEKAVVVNFPHGNNLLQDTLSQIENAVAKGATEIDTVLPVGRFLAGEREQVFEELKQQVKACGSKACLKVILETCNHPGSEDNYKSILDAANLALYAGGHPKTSTGKEKGGAELITAAVLMQATHDFNVAYEEARFVKPAGGMKTTADAISYLTLAQILFNEMNVGPKHLRLGASSVMDSLLKSLLDLGFAFDDSLVDVIKLGYMKSSSGY